MTSLTRFIVQDGATRIAADDLTEAARVATKGFRDEAQQAVIDATDAGAEQVAIAAAYSNGAFDTPIPGAPSGERSALHWTEIAKQFANGEPGAPIPTQDPNLRSSLHWADRSRAIANADTDADVPGFAAGQRGAKFWADQAGAGAAAATGAIGVVKVGIGSQANPATATLGTTAPDAGNAGLSTWSNGIPFPADSVLVDVTLRTSGAVTFQPWIVDGVTGRLLAKGASNLVFSGSGVQTVSIGTSFGTYVAPANAMLFLRYISGAGRIRTDAAGQGAVSVPAADANVGDILTITVTANTRLAISFTVQSVSNAATPRVAALENSRPALERGEAQTGFLLQAGALDAISGAGGNPSCPGVPIYDDVLITHALAHYTAVGRTFIEFWSLTRLGTAVLRHRTSSAVIVGQNEIALPGGGWRSGGAGFLIFRRIDGVHPSFTNNTGGFFFIAATSLANIGDEAAVSYTVSPAVNIGARVRRFQTSAFNPRGPESTTGPITRVREFFPGTTTPANWALDSAFSVNEGLIATGTGGWNNRARFRPFGTRGASSTTRNSISASITIQSTNFVGGIGGDSASGGAVAMIDMTAGTNGRLIVYQWNGLATGTINFQADFAAALVNGRRYSLTVTRNVWTITAILTDALTGNVVATASGTPTGVNNATSARFHGAPSVLHIGGTARWDWVSFCKDGPANVKAVVMGDSNYEGTLLSGGLSWVEQLNANYPGLIVNASRGGANARDMVDRLEDLTDYRPRFAIMGMGTNDTDLRVWRSCVRLFIDAARQIGAEPILMVPMPDDTNGTTQAFITSVANDIYGNFFGRIRYIDQLSVLSNNNDRLTWNPTFRNDAKHANAAGQTKVLAQVLIDVPELAL